MRNFKEVLCSGLTQSWLGAVYQHLATQVGYDTCILRTCALEGYDVRYGHWITRLNIHDLFNNEGLQRLNIFKTDCRVILNSIVQPRRIRRLITKLAEVRTARTRPGQVALDRRSFEGYDLLRPSCFLLARKVQ